MNLSSFTSPPADPSPYNNFRPLLISGGIVVGVTVFLLAIHFILSRSDPHHAPARSDPTGEDVEKVLVLIPVIPYAKDKQSRSVSVRDCSVCLSAMAEGEKVRILPGCGHGFHVQCIDEWLRNQLNCPICRLPVMPPQTCVDIPLVVAQAASAAAGASKPCEPCCNRELSC